MPLAASSLNLRSALTAVEAGRTGHIIISTLHANSAIDAYNRILSMCVSTGVRLSESKLLEFILEAMPLILFKRQLPDGRRIYDEIFEGLKIENGKVKGKTIFKYEIKEWINVNKVDRKKRKNYTLINIASFSLGVRPLL